MIKIITFFFFFCCIRISDLRILLRVCFSYVRILLRAWFRSWDLVACMVQILGSCCIRVSDLGILLRSVSDLGILLRAWFRSWDLVACMVQILGSSCVMVQILGSCCIRVSDLGILLSTRFKSWDLVAYVFQILGILFIVAMMRQQAKDTDFLYRDSNPWWFQVCWWQLNNTDNECTVLPWGAPVSAYSHLAYSQLTHSRFAYSQLAHSWLTYSRLAYSGFGLFPFSPPSPNPFPLHTQVTAWLLFRIVFVVVYLRQVVVVVVYVVRGVGARDRGVLHDV